MCAAALCGFIPTAHAVSDIVGHWSEPYIMYLDAEGIINPSSSTGFYEPDRKVTRAEFMRYINRAFHFTEKATITYEDVPEKSWYYEPVQIAERYGYISGVSDKKINPLGLIDREQAATIIGRLVKLDPGNVTADMLPFSDKQDISNWSAGYIKMAADKGIISGYGDNSFQPKKAVTRAEVAKILYGFMGTSLSQTGKAYTGQDLKTDVANVTISESAALSNAIINGDLYLTEGLGADAVTLSNVTVKGAMIISGGAVTLINSQAEQVVLSSPMGRQLSITAVGACQFPETLIGSTVIVSEKGPFQQGYEGFSHISTMGSERVSLTVDASVNTLTLNNVSTVSLAEKAMVHTLTAKQSSSITGTGSIYQADVQANGVIFASSVAIKNFQLGQNVVTTAGGAEITVSSPAKVYPDSIEVFRNNLSWLGTMVDVHLPVGQQVVKSVSCDDVAQPENAAFICTEFGLQLPVSYLANLPLGNHTLIITLADETQHTISVLVSN